MSDEPKDTWTTHERQYCIYEDRFLKRSLGPSEYKLDFRGQTHVPVANEARLENEAACLRYIKTHTHIPVPKVLDAYKKDNSYYLWTELISGVPMKELSKSEQAVVIKELEGYLKSLHSLRSHRVGGPTGIICPPNWVTSSFPKDRVWPVISSTNEDFVFCHCDLSQSNVIVDPNTLTVNAIIDFELGGFYTKEFEIPFYRCSMPSGAQIKGFSDCTKKLVEFFQYYYLCVSLAMSNALPLLQGQITLDAALQDDDNMLHKIAYPTQRFEFFMFLFGHRGDIEVIVCQHLGLTETETCQVGEFKDWMAGSFNVCIPVNLQSPRFPSRVIIRFPLPYKVGEARYTGNADEKVRCEAATYLWIQDNCPTIPIPILWGFGFAGGQNFTKPENTSFPVRLLSQLRRILFQVLRYPTTCRYISRTRANPLGIGYLIMEFIEQTEGKMLSTTWDELRHDQNQRTTLFKDISQIMLTLGASPMARIGSMTIDNDGVLSLTNRPLTLRLQQLENDGVPTHISRNLTYAATESYIHDLLAYHDHRIRHQPNSVYNELDGRTQIATLTMMRAVAPSFLDRNLRHGPFILAFTDLHQSNILVDDDWHIKRLIDLEWTCSLPVEMQHPPYWLTGRGVDELHEEEHLEAFSRVYEEFLDIFEQEERSLLRGQNNKPYRAGIMRTGWKIGNFWYFHALESPRGMMNLWLQHIRPRFTRSHDESIAFDQAVAPYWATDAAEVIVSKVKDKQVYDDQLRKTFNLSVQDSNSGNH